MCWKLHILDAHYAVNIIHIAWLEKDFHIFAL